ncbi:hypothetical protein [Actinoplanes sp. NPDC051411]|uniref:hypothetical protein n=1 Tax=Actinoplanes sp. NPDC051411 TaxID=3155522 RepID=UPI003439781F
MTISYASPLVVLNDADRRDPWLAPTFPPGLEEPRLEDGERVVHRVREGHVTLQLRGTGDHEWTDMWSPPRRASVVVTDRRLVLGCREFDRGSSWTGFGAAAFVVAAGATAISRARARRATAGHCLALQWRHEWPTAVAYLAGEPGWLSGLPAERIVVIAEQPGARWRLIFGHRDDRDTRGGAERVLSAIVGARLGEAGSLEPAERAALRRLASDPRLRGPAGESTAVLVPGGHAIGWRPAGGTLTPVAPPPAGSRAACADESCEAYDLPTPLAVCDMCGHSTVFTTA